MDPRTGGRKECLPGDNEACHYKGGADIYMLAKRPPTVLPEKNCLFQRFKVYSSYEAESGGDEAGAHHKD